MDREPEVFSPAASRCSISAASRNDSSTPATPFPRTGLPDPLDISDLPTRHNSVLALWQSQFERILAGWVGELGVSVLREHEVVGFAQQDTAVDVELSDGTLDPS